MNPITNKKYEEYFKNVYKKERNSLNFATINWNKSQVEITIRRLNDNEN